MQVSPSPNSNPPCTLGTSNAKCLFDYRCLLVAALIGTNTSGLISSLVALADSISDKTDPTPETDSIPETELGELITKLDITLMAVDCRCGGGGESGRG